MQTKSYDTNNLATSWMRIAAYIVDGIILGLISLVLSLPFGLLTVFSTALASTNDSSQTQAAVANLTSSFSFLLMSLIGFLVNVVGLIVIPMFLWKGQSVGKKLLKIKIVKSTGAETENMDILKRYAVPFGLSILGVIPVLNILICCVSPIVSITNLVLLFSDDKRQTLFDKVAETLVVNE